MIVSSSLLFLHDIEIGSLHDDVILGWFDFNLYMDRCFTLQVRIFIIQFVMKFTLRFVDK